MGAAWTSREPVSEEGKPSGTFEELENQIATAPAQIAAGTSRSGTETITQDSDRELGFECFEILETREPRTPVTIAKSITLSTCPATTAQSKTHPVWTVS
jgi:hypothetical protein